MKAVIIPLLFSAMALAHPQGLVSTPVLYSTGIILLTHIQWWGTDDCYPSPDNTDNQCSDSQGSGFDWSDLLDSDDWAFEGFNFVGVSPQDNCGASGVSPCV